MQQQFKEFKRFKAQSLYETPKPKHTIRTKAQAIKNVGPKLRVTVDKVKNEKPNTLPSESKKDIEFDYFGTHVGFNIDSNMKNARFYPQNQQGVKNFFEQMASSEYSYLIADIQRLSKALNLNDWGVYLLVNTIATKLYANRDNSDLFSWFVLSKLGYLVKVGISNRHIVLMHHSKNIIYAAPSYKFKNRTYYVLSEFSQKNIAPLYSYEQEYPDASKEMDLTLDSLPLLSQDIRQKTLVFKYFDKEHRFTYSYNQNLIDFMATYPQAHYEAYFNAPMQKITYDSLVKGLKSVLDSYQASKAINFVLNFVQNAFNYQVDEKQFGKEKVMFAQETLYYDYSDCEDRAILFASLVKNMFKIGIIGVKYKNHMATALYVPLSGDSIKVKGRKFVIADPTYINANIGQSMPSYKYEKPEDFIFLKAN